MSHKAHRDLPRVNTVGARAEEPKPRCRRGNNPYGHPADCSCRRPSQAVPYEDDKPAFTPSRFTAWWPGDEP